MRLGLVNGVEGSCRVKVNALNLLSFLPSWLPCKLVVGIPRIALGCVFWLAGQFGHNAKGVHFGLLCILEAILQGEVMYGELDSGMFDAEEEPSPNEASGSNVNKQLPAGRFPSNF